MVKKVYGSYAHDQLRARLTDLWVRGVRKLPLPKEYFDAGDADLRSPPEPQRADAHVAERKGTAAEKQPVLPLAEGQTDEFHQRMPRDQVNVSRGQVNFRLQEFLQCRICGVCQNSSEPRSALRQTASAASQGTRAHEKSVFVLLDQPHSKAGFGDDLSDKSSPNSLIGSLLNRARLQSQAHVSYALKAPLHRMPEDGWVKICAKEWLEEEIEYIRPQVVLAFGHRALLALRTIRPEPMLAVDAGQSGQISASYGPLRVYVFPSALELEHCPSWRQGVWAVVSQLY